MSIRAIKWSLIAAGVALVIFMGLVFSTGVMIQGTESEIHTPASVSHIGHYGLK